MKEIRCDFHAFDLITWLRSCGSGAHNKRTCEAGVEIPITCVGAMLLSETVPIRESCINILSREEYWIDLAQCNLHISYDIDHFAFDVKMPLLLIKMEIVSRRPRISRDFEAVLYFVADWQRTQSHSLIRNS